MAKPAREFFDSGAIPWTPVTGVAGAFERVLASDESGAMVTRILRWEPGLDTSPIGPVVHDYFEEIFILSGSMRDLTLDETFGAGFYASRPPGMVHGPWVSEEGCVMVEVRY